MSQQKPNPYLSAPLYGLTHFEPGQSDTIPYPVKRGTFRADLSKMPHVPGGPVNIMNLASTDPGYMWAVSTARAAYQGVRRRDAAEDLQRAVHYA
jgi:hypothetical protein